jgi:hypothetical protein
VQRGSNATAVAANATASASAANVAGDSGLAACFLRVLAAGGCAAHTPDVNLFAYHEDSGACGCCASDQVLPLDGFAGAVYAHAAAATLTAPDQCVSGSTLFYPAHRRTLCTPRTRRCGGSSSASSTCRRISPPSLFAFLN